MEEFPTEIQNRENTNHGVREEECRDGPISRQKDGVATDKRHDGSASTSDVSDIRLEPASIGQRFSGDSLCIKGFLEADEGECHDREVDELRSGDLDSLDGWGLYVGGSGNGTKLTNQFSTTAALLETWRKLRRAMTSTMQTQ